MIEAFRDKRSEPGLYPPLNTLLWSKIDRNSGLSTDEFGNLLNSLILLANNNCSIVGSFSAVDRRISA